MMAEQHRSVTRRESHAPSGNAASFSHLCTGTKAEAQALEAALAPVLDEAVLGQALELLRLLRALRCRGGDVIAAWEALPLECLLMLVSASARAQAAFQGSAAGHNGILVRIPLHLTRFAQVHMGV